VAPRTPSIETVSELAERHGFDLTPEEIATYRDVMAHTLEVLERLDAGRAAAPIAFTLGSATFGGGISLDEGLAEADRRLYARRAADRG